MSGRRNKEKANIDYHGEISSLIAPFLRFSMHHDDFMLIKRCLILLLTAEPQV